MSGVITGPHFLKFFDNPTALEVGTMVAVLEVGAFGVHSHYAYTRTETDKNAGHKSRQLRLVALATF